MPTKHHFHPPSNPAFFFCPFLATALRCNCTNCEKTGYECETDGACMASTYHSQGKEQHVRICISRVNLVPPGQPFYCLSAPGLLNTHCCYEDYCNSIDLKVPGEARTFAALRSAWQIQPSNLLRALLFVLSVVPTKEGEWTSSSWGPVELVAVIAGPVFLLCVLLMVGVFLFQYHQRAYSHRQRLEVEDPSCDHLYLAKDKTLQDLIYDMSTSGSGSGQSVLLRNKSRFWLSLNSETLGRHAVFYILSN